VKNGDAFFSNKFAAHSQNAAISAIFGQSFGRSFESPVLLVCELSIILELHQIFGISLNSELLDVFL
jgi:hypothetical protein